MTRIEKEQTFSAITRQLPDNYQTITRQLLDNYQTITRQLLGKFRGKEKRCVCASRIQNNISSNSIFHCTWQLSDNYPTITRQIPDKYLTTSRQFLVNFSAISRQYEIGDLSLGRLSRIAILFSYLESIVYLSQNIAKPDLPGGETHRQPVAGERGDGGCDVTVREKRQTDHYPE